MTEFETQEADRFEVVVVGGGAAGLSGAVALARARRSVLVVDAGNPRNAPAEGIHNYLTRDGMDPAGFVRTGRDEVRRFGGQIREGTIDAIERIRDGFALTIEDGPRVEAERLLVATGLVDQLPQIPGIAQHWGRDVLHCPYCHGWEVRDEPIAILATSALAVHQALMWRQWSEQVTVLRHTAGPFTDDQNERLAARGIDVVDGEVLALTEERGRLTGARVEGGTSVSARALVVAPRFAASASILTDLGLKTVDQLHEGTVIGSYIDADATGATAVPGVWVAGNVAGPTAQVVASAEAGLRAAGAINADLTEAETRRAVAERRRALTL